MSSVNDDKPYSEEKKVVKSVGFFQPRCQHFSQKHDKRWASSTLTRFIWLIQISRLGRIADDKTYVFSFLWEAHL